MTNITHFLTAICHRRIWRLVTLCLMLFSGTALSKETKSYQQQFTHAQQLHKLGKLHQAESVLVQLLVKNSAQLPVKAELAAVQSKLGKYQQALVHLEQLLTQNSLPNNVRVRLARLKQQTDQAMVDIHSDGFSGAVELALGHDTQPLLNAINDSHGGLMALSVKHGTQRITELGIGGFDILPPRQFGSETWVTDLISEPLNFFSYPCGQENAPLESCSQVLDGISSLGINAISISDRGVLDGDNNIISFRELSARLPENRRQVFKQQDNFSSVKASLRYRYQPRTSNWQWHNDFSVQRQQLDGETNQLMRFESVVDYRLNSQLILSGTAQFEEFEEAHFQIAQYRSYTPEIKYQSSIGLISFRHTWLDKTYSQKLLPHLSARDEINEFTWSQSLFDARLILSASYSRSHNKYTQNEYLSARDKSRNKRFLLSGLYQINHSTKAYASYSKNQLYAGDIEVQNLYQLSLTLDHQLADQWFVFASFEHDNIQDNTVFQGVHRNVYQTGIRWQF